MRTSLRVIAWLFWTALTSLIAFLLFVLLAKSVLLTYPSISANMILKWIYYHVGYPAAYYYVAVPIVLLFSIYFFRREMRRRERKYLDQLIEEVHLVEHLGFDHKIPVRPVGQLGQLASDINRMLERLKISIEEERRAEQTKNELITNVSHDLRTPLTTITGYLGLVEQDRYRDEVELRYYMNMAYEESIRLKKLLEDLFEYTRLRNRGIRLVYNKINLVEMLHQIVSQFGWQLHESGMEARLAFDGQLTLSADGDKLRRVFENLITNAIRYGQDGRYLDIRARWEEETVITEIINYGEPIPQQDLPHLFERFYRVEKSRAKHTGGSGIGLAIAKNIVELHHGEIRAESDEERTVFIVRLPQNNIS
ncbi:two-component sensor histidine kinase [Paenibacillus sp. CAA11]|uniref:sensor histidine kinase n=1 Tax=Paenibacillus sp. CAA11 TaxID=1532905 RepID=UPI000D3B5CAF|nr:HAMP domain-containing sensor histidine kinase [Paenibacillus sp. CAA11]AWB44440.1 two-component sensor histidine kinase [Paenibacillus sp. CAA11]